MTEEDLEPRTDREEMDIGVSVWNHFAQMTSKHGRKQKYSADATCRMEPEPPVWGLETRCTTLTKLHCIPEILDSSLIFLSLNLKHIWDTDI